ncbi:polysaccharide pyruvyl transferase family protein [Pseudomonas putida]|uniref:polysaccharide pyruvyl transferase family protein n=1 Tax=Pseudomonas putida TaxID=303 RepID=UPI00236428C5|nr:polysaccharide pyruvyl transferase family protein [Pseudomonas putida]MDD1989597.1 polysaccharide pyruvyl transferase family protein [Pseudomonas putida]HDS1796269.1 polysaccharide pyruvyl transferase family protein [Pseudomonas putida]
MSQIFTFGLEESIDGSSAIDTRTLYNNVGLNTGNLAFHYAINRLIGMVPPATPWSSDPQVVNGFGDLGILPCANQLGTHANLGGLAQNINKVDAKLVAIGLGAQSQANFEEIPQLPDGTLRWIEELIAHAPSKNPNITVRGDFTLRVLEHYGFEGNAVSLGCPTLFINKTKNLGELLEERYKALPKKVAIAAGHPSHVAMSRLEASLVRIMEDTNGSYIVQATDELVAFARGDMSYADNEFKNKLRTYLRLNLDGGQLEHWIRKYFIAFFNIPAWMEYLRRFDFVVGARIHGVMLAIQAGVPAVCIAYDSRIRELCEKSKIPYVMANDVKYGVTLNEIRGYARFDGKAFDKNRAELAEEYKNFMRNNGLPCTL